MPSITYIEESGPGKNEPGRDAKPVASNAPEPPARYDSTAEPPAGFSGPAQPGGRDRAASTRRLVTAAQVMAIVSLFIGGVLLSTASLVAAVIALRRSREGLYVDEGSLAWASLRRSAIVATAVAALALVANAVAIAVIYPMVMEALQSGDYSTLFSATPQTQNPGSGSSTWG